MASRELTLSAPAKTNLSLRVTGKRDDGFHGIETRMVRLALSDEITLRVAESPGEIIFTCSDDSLPTDDSNLAVKAARRFREETGREEAIEIELEKHIPVGAGLGGGSSDAASVLLGLNQLCETGLPTERLAEIGAELGSDVPFFLYETTCDCSGRGEIVTPVAPEIHQRLSELPVLLLKPSFPISAAFAYQKWADSKELPAVFYGEQLTLWGTIVNDLERPVFAKYLFLPVMKTWLLEQTEVRAAILSGSGSTMLAIAASHGRCHALAEKARAYFDKDLWVQATKTL